MRDLTYLENTKQTKYAKMNRRSFLKGALAVGGTLALAGCGESEKETVIQTVTATETKTVTVKETITVPEPGEEEDMITVPMMINPIYELCSGCKICMFECSLYHYGVANLANSNIVIHVHDLHRGTVDIATLCAHCNDAPCMASCPVKAISLDEVSKCLHFDHDKCILCDKCIEACNKDRTGCLRLDDKGEKVIGACDFCDNNPSCVMACPENSLRLTTKGVADGIYWAYKSDEIAEQVYSTIFGEYYKYLENR